MRTAICGLLGVELPIFAFSHCRDVVAAVTRAGGFGVLGASTVSPEQLAVELDWIDEHTAGRPYGVDVLIPTTYDDRDPAALIPAEHRAFQDALLTEAGVPELADDERGSRPAPTAPSGAGPAPASPSG